MLTSQAFAALLVCALGGLGCSREEPAAAVSPAAPESYMNDPVFMAKVKVQDKLQRKLMKQVAELNAKYEAAKAQASDPKVLAAMKAELDGLQKKFMEVRRQTAKIVAERLRAQPAAQQR